MARQTKKRLSPPKPKLTPSSNTAIAPDTDYPEARPMTTGVIASVAKGDVRKTLSDSIANGLIPVGIPTSQIDAKAVESDRQPGWEDNKEFDLLLQNIEERGQIQPVVVRPAVENWRPSDNSPLSVRETDRFVLLSGRRRYLACTKLGIPVRAIVRSKPDELDIEERFFENTVRQNLTQLEFHVSIGQIAESRGAPQSEVAKSLGVSQARVSKGLKIFRYLPELLKHYPEANSMGREYLYDAVDYVESLASEPAKDDDNIPVELEDKTADKVADRPSEADPVPPTKTSERSSTPPKASFHKVTMERPGLKGQFTLKGRKSALKISLDLPDDFSEDQAEELVDKIASLLR